MISAIVYDCAVKEMRQICGEIKNIIAGHCDEVSRIEVCFTSEEVVNAMNRIDLLDFACIDICGKDGYELAGKIRYKYPKVHILLIAETSISPVLYIRPSIMASALILRPASPNVLHSTLEEFMHSFLNIFFNEAQDIFVVETKSGITKIPFCKIYYYEANMKKVFIRLKTEEYSYYSTLEQILGQLPEYFIRCHRSFIVNKRKIVRYDAPNSRIVLDDDTMLPVSRSYRNELRDMLRQGLKV